MVRGDKGHWEIITIKSGEVEEKSKCFIPAEPAMPARKGKTSAKKQALNDANAARRAARWLNANFRKDSILLGLDYTDKAKEKLEERARKLMEKAGECEMDWQDAVWAAADHELRLCIDRVRRWCKVQGIELRYMAWTSDMDGKTGELVRVHHHLVIPRECLAGFHEKWGRGRVIGKPIQDEKDLTTLATYLCDQVRRIPDAKKYTLSRNLIQPVVTRRIAVSDAELRVPKNCELLYRGAHEPGWTSQYIRYYRPKTKRGQADGGAV